MTDADLARRTFRAFPRDRRSAGVRNHVLVVPSVICSGVVAETIADAVPEAACTPHDHGCGQIGADKDQTRRTLLNVGENPNVAGVLLVGLGCETLGSEALAADLDVPVRQTAIQTAGGTDEATEVGREAAAELVAEVRESRRREAGLSTLTLGVTISDLSDSTAERVNPAIGQLVRTVLDAGGQVAVGGVEPLVPHAADARVLSADDATAEALGDVLDHHREEIPPTGLRRSAVGHDAETISSLWDNAPITEVLAYGERVTDGAGVSVIDTPGGFEESATALAAAGAQVIVHGTGAGIPTGHPVVPVVKITGDSETAAALGDDIDIDAQTTQPRELVDRVLETASGQQTAAENHGLTSFALTRTGPSL